MNTLLQQIELVTAAYPEHGERLQSAHGYIQSDPSSSLTKSRTVLEHFLLDRYTSLIGSQPKRPMIGELLADKQFTAHFERRMLARIAAVKELANLGAHGETVHPEDAEKVFDELCYILRWFANQVRDDQSGVRRLPIYVLVDCSLRTSAATLSAIQAGLESVVAGLTSDPQTLETAWLSVIAYGSSGRQLVPLTSILGFKVPTLRTDPRAGCDLASGLQCFLDAVQRETKTATVTEKGDWMPISLFLANQSSDTDVGLAATMLRVARDWIHPPLVIATGDGVDLSRLQSLSDKVVRISEVGDVLAGWCKWTSPPIRT